MENYGVGEGGEVIRCDQNHAFMVNDKGAVGNNWKGMEDYKLFDFDIVGLYITVRSVHKKHNELVQLL